MRDGATPLYEVFRGTDWDGPAFRVVGKCPPSPDDFISYAMAGRGFSGAMFFRATGVSMFRDRDQAVRLARGGKLGTCVAELNLNDERVFFALTSENTGHLDVWAPPRVLVKLVVNCAEEGNE